MTRFENELVLLVEDSAADVLLTQRAFRKNGFACRLEVARDGEQALAYLHGTADAPPSACPQLVLLDLKLPKVDGLDVLRRLREHPRTARLPVVVLTSSKEQEDIAGSYRSGANAYVRKPIDFSEFVQAVNHLGFFWLALNQRPALE